jgi:hypothetical protein
MAAQKAAQWVAWWAVKMVAETAELLVAAKAE